VSTKDEGLAGSQPDPETRRLRDLIRSLEVWEMFGSGWTGANPASGHLCGVEDKTRAPLEGTAGCWYADLRHLDR
jgi:hypothetical protein